MGTDGIGRVRRRLETKRGQEYWRTLEELADSEAFAKYVRQEWPRLSALWDQPAERRTVLKMLAANLAVLGIAGCGRPPEEPVIPYVRQPESVVPGKPSFYATALSLSGYGIGVLAECHTGRPTRIEGNPDHPVNRGASTAFAQASVLELYDPDRSQATRHRGDIALYDSFLGDVAGWRDQMREDGGAGLRVLTGRVTSPTLEDQLTALRRQFPGMRWHVYEPAAATAPAAGARLAFGESVEAAYRLDHARVVLSLDADFLGVEDPSHIVHARDLLARRSLSPDGPPPARLYVVESSLTTTGAKADHRKPLAPSRIEGMARALCARLGVSGIESPAEEPLERGWLDALAVDLERHRGSCPVIAGSGQPAAVHAMVHALNAVLGNIGKSVLYREPVAAPGDAGIETLAEDIAAGEVRTLLILGGNPAYDAPADLEFSRLLEGVPHVVHWGLYYDETAALSEWHLPAAHELEAWGDARAVDGTETICQPAIRPLYGGTTTAELIAAFRGDFGATSLKLVRGYWQDRYAGTDFETFWRRALQRGYVEGSAAPPRSPRLREDLASRLPPPGRSGDLELRFRLDPAVWDGRYANNGWLQELPDPLSKLVWGNALAIAPALAEARGLSNGDIVRVVADGRRLVAPVWILPGQPKDSVTLHLGYGRPGGGRIGTGVGVDAYRLRTTDSLWFARDVVIEPTDGHATLATTQHHHTTEGRGLVREAAWEEYRADPGFAQRKVEQDLPSLYPEPSPLPDSSGEGWTPYEWGMVIDFDACVGCNACVTACQSENNIPFVGKEEVARGRDMHWLRIDRYFSGPPDNPDAVFQPVTCMHCENAPCEYVCPVGATQHSSEGLNEMIYNRCIGTRYCSQNCPYKVRRFNWFDYTGPDARFSAPPPLHNPDVTVRSRGVMEKCTYCVQRINRARIAAGRENRRIRDGEIVTACQQACPTQAIVFGDVADPDTAVSRRKAEPRNYAMLGEINTRPRTTYLAAVHHPNPEIDD